LTKKNRFREIAITLFLVLAVMLFIKHFVLNISAVNGASMETSINNGDIVISLNRPVLMFMKMINEKTYSGMLRDKIILVNVEGVSCIKRCVGVSGDTLLIYNGPVTADTVIVDDERMFVLGDNFRNSYDSRNTGQLSIKEVNGLMLARFSGKKK